MFVHDRGGSLTHKHTQNANEIVNCACVSMCACDRVYDLMWRNAKNFQKWKTHFDFSFRMNRIWNARLQQNRWERAWHSHGVHTHTHVNSFGHKWNRFGELMNSRNFRKTKSVNPNHYTAMVNGWMRENSLETRKTEKHTESNRVVLESRHTTRKQQTPIRISTNKRNGETCARCVEEHLVFVFAVDSVAFDFYARFS